MFSLLMWPVRYLWATVKLIFKAFGLMIHHPAAGLLALLSVLLRLTGIAGLVGSLVWAMTLPGSSLGAFVASCIQHGVVWLVAGSILALVGSSISVHATDTRWDEDDYRDELRMRRRVEREESARLTGR